MRTATRTAHTVGASGLAFAIAIFGVACTPEPEPEPDLIPTVMDTPALLWKDGIEPSSALEADARVMAVRAGEVGISMAWNTGDFTIAQLTEHVTQTRLKELVSVYRDGGVDRAYEPGPRPFEPLAIIEEFEDGGALVEVCRPVLSYAWYYNAFDTEDLRYGEVDPSFGTRLARVVREDGELKYAGDLLYSDEDWVESCACDEVPVAVGLFDPQPVIPEDPQAEPARPPLFEEQ